jgi:Zn-dependent protease
MMFLEPSRTAYDLNWQMFGIPVRVHPMFWLLTVILGWGAVDRGISYLLVWVACVFVSILIHELGHVIMGRRFGTNGHIVLYSFGGLAIGSSNLSNRWERIAVSFAGPLAGFLFLGVVIFAIQVVDPEQFTVMVEKVKAMLGLPFDPHVRLFQPSLVDAAVMDLFWINLFWGLLNLLPIWPLDGGQISRDFLEGVRPQDGVRISLGISCAVAALLAVNSLAVSYGKPIIPFLNFGGTYMAIFFGLMAVSSFQAMQAYHPSNRPWRVDRPEDYDDHDSWDNRRRDDRYR